MIDKLIERAKAALEIVGDDTWSLTPQETYDGRSTTQYYRVMDQNLNAICCEEYGAHCDGGVKKMRLIVLAPDLARALIREREAADRLAELLEEVQRQGCEVCNGDCSSAMPPVGYCPPRVRMEALTAYRKATKETNNDK